MRFSGPEKLFEDPIDFDVRNRLAEPTRETHQNRCGSPFFYFVGMSSSIVAIGKVPRVVVLRHELGLLGRGDAAIFGFGFEWGRSFLALLRLVI